MAGFGKAGGGFRNKAGVGLKTKAKKAALKKAGPKVVNKTPNVKKSYTADKVAK